MSIALDSRLFALSLFHLCSCNICQFFSYPIESHWTNQYDDRKCNGLLSRVCHLPQKKIVCPGTAASLWGAQLQLPCAQPKRPQSWTAWNNLSGNCTGQTNSQELLPTSNIFQPPSSCKWHPITLQKRPFCSKAFRSAIQSGKVCLYNRYEHTQRSEQQTWES